MVKQTYVENGVTINKITPNLTDLATDEVKAQRKNICIDCTDYSSEDNTCSNCGCIVETLMTYTNSQCPINKW